MSPTWTRVARVKPRTTVYTSAAPLNNDDRELSAFYATQIDAHAADVDASTAHRLVYGDNIARHVTDQSVGDRIAAAATAVVCLVDDCL